MRAALPGRRAFLLFLYRRFEPLGNLRNGGATTTRHALKSLPMIALTRACVLLRRSDQRPPDGPCSALRPSLWLGPAPAGVADQRRWKLGAKQRAAYELMLNVGTARADTHLTTWVQAGADDFEYDAKRECLSRLKSDIAQESA
jgi:hypothetical protein